MSRIRKRTAPGIKHDQSVALEIDRHQEQTPFSKPTDWICECANGSHHVPHHSHATALFAAGVTINAVNERLGHFETSTTMNIYVDTSPAMQQRAANETEAL